MSEEQQPKSEETKPLEATPVVSEQAPVATPEVVDPELTHEEPEEAVDPARKPYRCKLDMLPDHIKKDMWEMIAKGFRGVRVKRALEDRYLGKTNILPVTKETYTKYIQYHEDEIMKMVDLQKSLIDSTKESLSDMTEVVNATTDGSMELDNKKKVLESLFNKCKQRIQILEALNAGGWPNPQFEQIIGSYMKEQHAVVKTLVELQSELNKDTGEQTYREFENLTYMWLVTVLNTYKQINGETKFLEFKGTLTEELTKTLQSYLLNKSK